MDKVQQLIDSFDKTGVKFHDRSQAIEQFRESHTIEHSDEGAFATYDGQTLPLSEALLRFGYDRRDLCDGRTLPREGAGTARPGLDHKSLYDSASAAKVITERGLEYWESLPLTGPTTSEVKTKEDWYKLPRADKVKRLEADPDAFVKLPSASAEQRPVAQMVSRAGAKINVAALERQKKIRPNSR